MCPADPPERGRISADIPAEAVEDALRSVEAHDSARAAAGGVNEGAPALDVESLRSALAAAEARARVAEAKLAEEHDRLLRAAADLENVRKRAIRDRDEARVLANEGLVRDLLPVLDNLDRALAAVPPGDPLARGVLLVKKALEDALSRHGVRAFSALGQPFDPKLHEAIAQLPTPEAAAGTVVAEQGRGFLLNGRLLRPAMVAVASPPAETRAGVEPAGAASEDG